MAGACRWCAAMLHYDLCQRLSAPYPCTVRRVVQRWCWLLAVKVPKAVVAAIVLHAPVEVTVLRDGPAWDPMAHLHHPAVQ